VKVTVFQNERDAAIALADHITEALRHDPQIVLGLPTGSTPIYLYRELSARHARGEADFSRASTFNLDEFLGTAASNPASFRAFMDRHLFTRVNIDPSRINFLDGAASSPEEECERYERAIADAGGITIQVVGIGVNGHIGFNEPASSLPARTHVARLKPETRRANAALFGGDARRVPTRALSMGMGTILSARSIVVLATGRRKAPAVRGMLEGPLTTQLPASFLSLHQDVRVMLDRTAAGITER
jgi:glucosamine-6-phosphate deaminase